MPVTAESARAAAAAPWDRIEPIVKEGWILQKHMKPYYPLPSFFLQNDEFLLYFIYLGGTLNTESSYYRSRFRALGGITHI